MGKWFNQANSRNFPFLVKFDADLPLTEWLFTHGYERSAIVVMTITPTIADYAAKQWYLQPYDKVSPYCTPHLAHVTDRAQTTALLVFLRNHLARWFTVGEKSFCWVYDAVTMYSICHTFDLKLVNKLFYAIAETAQGQEISREPVVDSYLVFGTY